MKYDQHKEVYIIPPSEFLIPLLSFDSEGKLRGKKVQPISVLNLPTVTISPSKKLKIWRGKNKRLPKITDVVNHNLAVNAVFDANGLSIYMLWNYEKIYLDGIFDYKDFLQTVDELRVVLDRLENNSWSGVSNHPTDKINLRIISLTSGQMLQKGKAQLVMNACFENLPLPNSVTLYNYGYLSPKGMELAGRTHFNYFLDHGMGVNYHFNPICNDSGCSNKKLFTYGFSAHYEVERDYERNLKLKDYQLLSNGMVKDCEGAIVASSPADISTFSGKYLFLFSGVDIIDGRNTEEVASDVRKDASFLVVDSLAQGKSLFEYDTPDFSAIDDNLQTLGNLNQWLRFKNPSGKEFHRLFITPTMPIYTVWDNWNHAYKGFLPYGATPNDLEKNIYVKIKRKRINERGRFQLFRVIRGMTNETEMEREYAGLLLVPSDIVKVQ